MILTNVKHIRNYTLELTFDNGIVKKINLKEFITNSRQPMTNQFKNIERFKKAYIQYGNLTWEDGQMDLSAENILEINSENNNLA